MTNVNQPAANGAAAGAPGAAGNKLRVMIVEDETLVGMGLRKDLERLGHTVVAHASNADDARREYADKKPDLVFMDIRLDGADGIELAAELLQQRRCPMIILSAYSEQRLIERAGAAGVFGYLIKPASVEGLQAQVEVAFRRFQEHEKVRLEKDELAAALETRKLVERAKGIFMKRFNLEEPEAHKRLQQESQKRRITIGELAKKIIESEELLGSM
jgi:AmiR/NasT family two-component response regulator